MRKSNPPESPGLIPRVLAGLSAAIWILAALVVAAAVEAWK